MELVKDHCQWETKENSINRVKFTEEQRRKLEAVFERSNTIRPSNAIALAEELNVTSKQIQTWFQNKRANVRRNLMKKSGKAYTLKPFHLTFLQSHKKHNFFKTKVFPSAHEQEINIQHSQVQCISAEAKKNEEFSYQMNNGLIIGERNEYLHTVSPLSPLSFTNSDSQPPDTHSCVQSEDSVRNTFNPTTRCPTATGTDDFYCMKYTNEFSDSNSFPEDCMSFCDIIPFSSRNECSTTLHSTNYNGPINPFVTVMERTVDSLPHNSGIMMDRSLTQGNNHFGESCWISRETEIYNINQATASLNDPNTAVQNVEVISGINGNLAQCSNWTHQGTLPTSENFNHSPNYFSLNEHI